MRKKTLFCVLFLLFSALSVGVLSEYAETFAQSGQKIEIYIDGERYEQTVSIYPYAYFTAQKYGSFYNYAMAEYQKGIDEKAIFNYLSNGLGDAFFKTLKAKETPPINATVDVLDSYPYFVYRQGKRGLTFKTKDAIKALAKALDGQTSSVDLTPTDPDETISTLKEKTKKIGEFSTSFVSSTENRKTNVKVALSYINGKVLKSGESFSFNQTVGERTEERGFKEAKVILNGKYVEGIGGGVCQVATTLYGAILKAGLDVVSVARHTYAPAYVQPSLDAMVSEYTDLVFSNQSECPVYIFTSAKGDKATVSVYGKPFGLVNVYSNTIKTIPYANVDENGKILTDLDGYEKLSSGVDGIESVAFREINGKKVKIREDRYPPLNAVYSKKTDQG